MMIQANKRVQGTRHKVSGPLTRDVGRNIMKLALVYLAAGLTIPLSGLCQIAPQDIATSNILAQAIQRGEDQAKADIANGTMQLRYYGKPWPTKEAIAVEQITLPVTMVGGCDVTEEFRAETEAYNAAMRQAVSEKIQK